MVKNNWREWISSNILEIIILILVLILIIKAFSVPVVEEKSVELPSQEEPSSEVVAQNAAMVPEEIVASEAPEQSPASSQ